MSDKIPTSEISIIEYQADITSGQHRQNYANIRNRHNALCDTVASSTIGATNAETTASRPYNTSLKDRLDTMGGNINTVLEGGDVSELPTPTMRVKVKAVKAQVGGVTVCRGYATFARVTTTATITENNHGLTNGDTIYIDVSSSVGALPTSTEYTVANATTNTFDITSIDAGDATGTIEFSRYTGVITNSTTYSRTDIVVINSDASISVVTGPEGTALTSNLYPAISVTQRPLAYLYVQPVGGILSNTYIVDMRVHGCIVNRREWYFTIQEAVDSVADRRFAFNYKGDVIEIFGGRFIEEVDISNKTNLTLDYKCIEYHTSGYTDKYCIVADNTSTQNNIKILNGNFAGSSLSTVELVKLVDIDSVVLSNISYIGVTYSLSYTLTDCVNITVIGSDIIATGVTEIYSQKEHDHFHGVSTQNTVYTKLIDLFESDGDTRIINGAIAGMTISYIERIDGVVNKVVAYGIQHSGGAPASYDMEEGSIVPLNFSIAW